MRAELTLPQEFIDLLADKVVERLEALLSNDGKDDDEILSIEQASQLLGKSKGQIYQWVSQAKRGLNNFPYMKAGKSLRFSKKALIDWMSNR